MVHSRRSRDLCARSLPAAGALLLALAAPVEGFVPNAPGARLVLGRRCRDAGLERRRAGLRPSMSDVPPAKPRAWGANPPPEREKNYVLPPGKIPVRFTNKLAEPGTEDVVVAAEEGEPICDVADRAGVKIATACRSGICKTCMTDLEAPTGGMDMRDAERPGWLNIKACVSKVALPAHCDELVLDVWRHNNDGDALRGAGADDISEAMKGFAPGWETESAAQIEKRKKEEERKKYEAMSLLERPPINFREWLETEKWVAEAKADVAEALMEGRPGVQPEHSNDPFEARLVWQERQARDDLPSVDHPVIGDELIAEYGTDVEAKTTETLERREAYLQFLDGQYSGVFQEEEMRWTEEEKKQSEQHVELEKMRAAQDGWPTPGYEYQHLAIEYAKTDEMSRSMAANVEDQGGDPEDYMCASFGHSNFRESAYNAVARTEPYKRHAPIKPEIHTDEGTKPHFPPLEVSENYQRGLAAKQYREEVKAAEELAAKLQQLEEQGMEVPEELAEAAMAHGLMDDLVAAADELMGTQEDSGDLDEEEGEETDLDLDLTFSHEPRTGAAVPTSGQWPEPAPEPAAPEPAAAAAAADGEGAAAAAAEPTAPDLRLMAQAAEARAQAAAAEAAALKAQADARAVQALYEQALKDLKKQPH